MAVEAWEVATTQVEEAPGALDVVASHGGREAAKALSKMYDDDERYHRAVAAERLDHTGTTRLRGLLTAGDPDE